MKIQVLGTGCASCSELYARVEEASASSGVPADLEKVESLEEIAAFGVVMAPGLAVDGEVKSVGKLPAASAIAAWLAAAAER